MKTINSTRNHEELETMSSQYVTKDVAYVEEETDYTKEEPTSDAYEPETAPLDQIIGEEAKVDITGVEVNYGLDGKLISNYTGTVDGHCAEFVADEEGEVVMLAVDYDDNGQFDLDEVASVGSKEVSELDLIARDNVGESLIPVEIEDVDVVFNENDEAALLVTGKFQGHDAAFLDDGYGNVVKANIDVNDNGIIEENETFELDPGDLTTEQLLALDTVVEEEESRIEITNVETVVNNHGEEVELISGTYEGHEVFFVDDTEGNLVLGGIDANDNGTFEISEIMDFEPGDATVDDLLACSDIVDDSNADYAAMS